MTTGASGAATAVDPPQVRLWTPRGFRDDPWNHVGDAREALAGDRPSIVPLVAYLALDEDARAAASGRLGVLIAPGEALDAILPHLARLPLIALAFPAFTDGRSYSKAYLLRARHGYAGTIRATGDVLIDQIPLMVRAGFDAFEVSGETTLRRLGQNRPGGIAFLYQPGVPGAPAGERYSWRRRAEG